MVLRVSQVSHKFETLEEHTLCFTSLALSPATSFAASARVPMLASLSLATSDERSVSSCVVMGEQRSNVLLLASLEVLSTVLLTVSVTELAAFL